MNTYKVIALTGAKGSGKDTVARIIKQYATEKGLDTHTVAFADPIKKVIQHLFDLDPANYDQYDLFKRSVVQYQLDGYLTHFVNGRHIVREIGMLMRGYDEEQFNRYVSDCIRSQPDALWIVTDMRFENEYNMLKSVFGAKMIKVKRSNTNYDRHVTEREFSDYRVRYLLENFGTEEELRNQVIDLFETIRKDWE